MSEEFKAELPLPPPIAAIYTIDKVFRPAISERAANVRSAREGADGAITLEHVTLREPVTVAQELILVRSVAEIIGIYNPAPDFLSPAYGSPKVDKAWVVSVGCTYRPFVSSGAFVYEALVAHRVKDYDIPKD